MRRHAAERAAVRAFMKAFGVVALGSLIAAVAGLFFGLIAAFVAGSVAGQVLSPAINRKTRRWIYALGALTVFGGALAGMTAGIMVSARPGAVIPVEGVVLLLLQSWAFWLFVAIAAAVGYYRLR